MNERGLLPRTGLRGMKIWPYLLLSVTLHLGLFGWLAGMRRFRPPDGNRCLNVAFVSFAKADAVQGENRQGSGPGGQGVSEVVRDDPERRRESSHPEEATDFRESTGGEAAPGRVPAEKRVMPRRAKPSAGRTFRKTATAGGGSSEPRRAAEPSPAENTAKPGGSPADEGRQVADAPGIVNGTGEAGGGVGGGADGERNVSAAAGAPLETGLNARGGPRFLKRVLPEYPRRARELGKAGTVVLRVTIDARGLPTRVEALKKLGFGLDDEAVRALENSTFTPARSEGRLVACRVIVPVRFELKALEDD